MNLRHLQISAMAVAAPVLLYAQSVFVPGGTVGTSSNSYLGVGTSSPADTVTIQAGHYDTRLRLFSDHYGQGVDGVNTSSLALWASEPDASWTGAGIGNNFVNDSGFSRVTTTRGGSFIRLLDNELHLHTVDSQGDIREAIIVSDGKVGIGGLTPLGYSGAIVARGLFGDASSSYAATVNGANQGERSSVSLYSTFEGTADNIPRRTADIVGGFSGGSWGAEYLSINVGSSTDSQLMTAEKVRFTASGNVGIGTTTPSHKLAVNGTIRAKEIIVDTGWADYVFADGYELNSLPQVEAYIARSGHLPGLPSAADVAENGISLGEMQTLLLAKIEELTLHQIAQEKQIHAQSERIDNLESKNRDLQQRMSSN